MGRRSHTYRTKIKKGGKKMKKVNWLVVILDVLKVVIGAIIGQQM